METLNKFLAKNAHRLWKDKYLNDCIFMVQRLSNFEDFESKPLDEFKAADIYGFMDHLSKQGLKDTTINRYLACFSVVFSMAVEQELMTQAPKVRWKKARNSRPRFFSDTEVKDLTEFLADSDHPWMADFVTLGVNTGMRLGEIVGINNEDTKKTSGTLSDCGQFITLSNTKNGDERLVPLNIKAQQALSNLDNCPSKFYSHRKFYNTWNEARDALARGDEHYVFHVLRHTCATRLAMEFNVDAITLGKILGHKSQATTAKYVHAQPSSLQNIMSKLEATREAS